MCVVCSLFVFCTGCGGEKSNSETESSTKIIENTYYYYDDIGDVWYYNGTENVYIGSGENYYIDSDGSCVEKGDEGGAPNENDQIYNDNEEYYWCDSEGMIFYWDGNENEFIGTSNYYYLSDDGSACYEIQDANSQNRLGVNTSRSE